MNEKQDNAAAIRDYFQKAIEVLSGEIASQIKEVGGREMLLSRIDVTQWVAFAEEELEMYREVIRFLDGEDGIDLAKVIGACQRQKFRYQQAVEEIERLQEQMREMEQHLKQNMENLPWYKLSVDVLTEMLKNEGNPD